MISKKDVQNIAKLARLSLSEKEIEKYQEEISEILDYIEKLKEVNVENVKAMSHPIEVENVLRNDKEKREDSERIKKLLDLMPETKNGYLKTKPIF